MAGFQMVLVYSTLITGEYGKDGTLPERCTVVERADATNLEIKIGLTPT
jgi:hypothetical protein